MQPFIIVTKTSGVSMIMPIGDLRYALQWANYTEIFTNSGSINIKETLEELLEKAYGTSQCSCKAEWGK